MTLDDFNSREELLRRLQQSNRPRKRRSLHQRLADLEQQVAQLSEQLAYCTARLAQLPLKANSQPASKHQDLMHLTPREREILVAFSKEPHVAAVAKRLRRNYHTVRNQLLAAQQRLGLNSRKALICWIAERQNSGNIF